MLVSAAAASIGFAASTGAVGASSASPSDEGEQQPPAALKKVASTTAATHPLLLPADSAAADGAAVVDDDEDGDAEVEAVADRAWLKLKQFSLLTVREVHGERTGVLHRLLSQSLRAHLGPERKARVLSSCAWAVERHFEFDPADTTTWSAATAAIEHVQAVGRHTLALLKTLGSDGGSERSDDDLALLAALQLRVSALLTHGALCMSMALSRFEPARLALEAARAIQEQPLGGSRGTSNEMSVDLRRGHALTLDTAGKVARYCGQLGEAESLLREALSSWRGLNDEGGQAATLHELGVVSLRRADWNGATALLQQSLDMKRRNRQRRSSREGMGKAGKRREGRFREEAATLHQLAVAAMSSKPARLDEASKLLREALALESDGPFALGGRAATLQQLARVAERRGDRDGALAHLQDALELHKKAYGEGVPHVNKAAVLSQLASLSLQASETDRAAGYLHEALTMRRQIYGHGGACHVEMALNLNKLGECERARGDLPAASQHFEAARTMLETLALREASAPSSLLPSVSFPQSPLQRIIRIVMSVAGGEGAPTTRLLNQILSTIRWQRTVAKEVERRDPGVGRSSDEGGKAAELAGEAQQLQHAIEQHEASGEAANGATGAAPAATQPGGALVEPTILCRNEVRAALLELRGSKDADGGVKQIDRMRTACEELKAVASQVAEEAAEAYPAGEGESNAGLRDAALAFVVEIRGAADELGPSKSFLARGFAACDLLRARLREEGTALTDVQTADAYQTRVTHLAAAGDYMLSSEAMRRLQTSFGELSVDAFASGATALLPRFWSGEAVDGAEAVDAFAQSWAGERLLVHAPVGCLFEVIEKLEREPEASAVVVCPYWTGAPWFEPLAKLASDSIVLPAGSLRAVASRTKHVRSWRAVAFHVPPRGAEDV